MGATPSSDRSRLIGSIASLVESVRENPGFRVSRELEEAASALQTAGVAPEVYEALLFHAAACGRAGEACVSDDPKTILVVGGRGMMGGFFRTRLESMGHTVRSLDAEDWGEVSSLAQGASLALVCVPIDSTIEVIGRIGAALSVSTVLADITSIKAPAMEAMLAAHAGPVIGLHPMFGPGVRSMRSQRIVVCPGRDVESAAWFLRDLERDGGVLVESDAGEHDRMMIAVQAIRHFSTFALGVFLAKEDGDIDRTLEFASPIYRLELDMVDRLFAQDAALYVDIMLATPERREAISRLAEVFAHLAALAAGNDRAALLGAFIEAGGALGSESGRALDESNFVVRSLAARLAANG